MEYSEDWIEIVDTNSGAVYYYNTLTGETQWSLPNLSSGESRKVLPKPWAEAFDAVTEQIFYYNTESGESLWTIPIGETALDNLDNGISYLNYAALRIQARWRGQKARYRVAAVLLRKYKLGTDEIISYRQTKSEQATVSASSNIVSTLLKRLIAYIAVEKNGDANNLDNNDESSNNNDFDYLESMENGGEQEESSSDLNDEREEIEGTVVFQKQLPRSKAQKKIDKAEAIQEEIEKALSNGYDGVAASVSVDSETHLSSAIGIFELDLQGLKCEKLSSRLWNLSHLNHLNLSNNILTRIPSGIQDLTQLKYLNVSHNRLTSLPSSLQTVLTLKELIAHHNHIKSFSPGLWKLSEIEELDLSWNNLKKLPYAEGDLKLLREMKEWSIGIGMLRKLRILRLQHNQLVNLPLSLERCYAMEILHLANNQIKSLTDDICNLTLLKELDFQCNRILKLPNNIGALNELISCNFSNNELQSIPESIGQLHRLEVLQLSRNKLDGLPNSLSNLINLKRLEIDNNTGIRSLQESLEHLCNIEIFSATNCGLTFIHTNILKKSPVCELHLAHNQLLEFPIPMGNVVRMRETLLYLNLSNNNLNVAPNEILQYCTNLRTLNLSRNSILLINSTIKYLQLLEYLFLNENHLSRLPDEVTKLTTLKVLTLNKNNLISLPLSIGNLKSLQHLDISFNQLQILPSSVKFLTGLKSLVACNNQLKVYPPMAKSLTCYINLSNNLFQDDKYLSSLDQDSIPQCTQRTKVCKVLFQNAMKEIGANNYELAELFISELIACLHETPQEMQLTERPRYYFLRGNCRYQQLQTQVANISHLSSKIQQVMKNIHHIKLLHLRQQSSATKRSLLGDIIQETSNKVLPQQTRMQLHGVNTSMKKSNILNMAISNNDHDAFMEEQVKNLKALTEKCSLARQRAKDLSVGAIEDLEYAIKFKCQEISAAYYIKGVVENIQASYYNAIYSLSNGLQTLYKSLVNKGSVMFKIMFYLQRSEAYRQLGQLQAAQNDIKAILTDCLPNNGGSDNDQWGHERLRAEERLQIIDNEWIRLHDDYLVDNLGHLSKGFEFDPVSGILQRREVLDPYDNVGSIAAKRLMRVKPKDRLLNEIEILMENQKMQDEIVLSRIKSMYEGHNIYLRKIRAFQSEITSNMEMQQEENNQRLTDMRRLQQKELLDKLKETETKESKLMEFEDSYMRWLLSEEKRLNDDRLRKIAAQQKLVEDKAAYALRLSKRGGRRQRLTRQINNFT